MQKLYWAVQKIYRALQKNLLGSGKLYWAVQNMNWGTQTINTRAARGDWNQLLNYISYFRVWIKNEHWTLDSINQLFDWFIMCWNFGRIPPISWLDDQGSQGVWNWTEVLPFPKFPLGCAPCYWMTINLGSTATNITSGLNEIHATWSGRKYWTLQFRGKKLESWNCEVLQPPVAAGGKAR